MEVKDLKKYYSISSSDMKSGKAVLKAVDGVSFDLKKGEILGIVGESGCGKSTLGKTVLRLHDKTDGKVLYNGEDLFEMNRRDITALRRRMQMVFQDPFSS